VSGNCGCSLVEIVCRFARIGMNALLTKFIHDSRCFNWSCFGILRRCTNIAKHSTGRFSLASSFEHVHSAQNDTSEQPMTRHVCRHSRQREKMATQQKMLKSKSSVEVIRNQCCALHPIAYGHLTHVVIDLHSANMLHRLKDHHCSAVVQNTMYMCCLAHPRGPKSCGNLLPRMLF
jgi:hypothetical protein